jgi:hypothetical protein
VLSDLRLENGRIPLGIAPIQPDDPLELIAVQPQNVVLAPHVPERMGTAWNNLASSNAEYTSDADFVLCEQECCKLESFLVVRVLLCSFTPRDEFLASSHAARTVEERA